MININLIRNNLIGLEIFIIVIKGKRRAISTSKIKKMMAIKKNWFENGSREQFHGSNPHSNGDLFSRSIILFFEIKFNVIIRIIITLKITITIRVIILIIYTKSRFFDWKSNIIFILYKYLPHQ